MERRKNAPTTRRRSYVRPGLFVCRNPYHSDWGSSSTSAKSDHVRSSVLEVLSAVAGYRVTKICRDCRRLADDRLEITRHPLYTPATVGIVIFILSSCQWADSRQRFQSFFLFCLQIRGTRRQHAPPPSATLGPIESLSFSDPGDEKDAASRCSVAVRIEHSYCAPVPVDSLTDEALTDMHPCASSP